MAKLIPLKLSERTGMGVMGEELYQYLLHFKKETYRELQQSGELLPYLRETGMRLDDMVIDLMQSGLGESGAKEIARAEFNEDAMY